MPTFSFDPNRRLIEGIAHARDGTALELIMVLDTAATMTGLSRATIMGLGINPDAAKRFA